MTVLRRGGLGRKGTQFLVGIVASAALTAACHASFDECKTSSGCIGGPPAGTSSLSEGGSNAGGENRTPLVGGEAGHAPARGGAGAGTAGETFVAGIGGGGGADDDEPGPVNGCAWDAPFGTPEVLPPPFNSSVVSGMPTNDSFWLSDDGLSAYFSARSNALVNDFDIFYTRRASNVWAFPEPQPLPSFTSLRRERQLTLSADELLLVYQELDAIHASMRSSIDQDFPPGAPLPNPINVEVANVLSGEPFITRDGAQLYFTSNRDGGYDLYSASIEKNSLNTAVAVSDVTPLSELNTSHYDGAPLLSADGLTIYYQSGANADVWVAHRRTQTGKFENPQAVTELNSQSDEWPEAISPDGCRIYLCRTAQQDFTLFEARRAGASP